MVGSKGWVRGRRVEGVQDWEAKLPPILEGLGKNPDLDTLVVALYVTVDDSLVAHPDWAPERPAVGIAPKLSDAELVASAVLSVLLGFDSERRFVRWARANLRAWFPYLPGHAGYNKRLRRSAEMLRHAIGALGRDCPAWCDDVWLVDSTPGPAGAAAPPSSAPTWRDGPNTATAPAVPAGSGGCACTCWPHRRGCPSPSRSPAPKQTNARPAWA